MITFMLGITLGLLLTFATILFKVDSNFCINIMWNNWNVNLGGDYT